MLDSKNECYFPWAHGLPLCWVQRIDSLVNWSILDVPSYQKTHRNIGSNVIIHAQIHIMLALIPLRAVRTGHKTIADTTQSKKHQSSITWSLHHNIMLYFIRIDCCPILFFYIKFIFMTKLVLHHFYVIICFYYEHISEMNSYDDTFLPKFKP